MWWNMAVDDLLNREFSQIRYKSDGHHIKRDYALHNTTAYKDFSWDMNYMVAKAREKKLVLETEN